MAKSIVAAQSIPDEMREEILSIGFLVKGVSKESLEMAIAKHGFYAEEFRESGSWLWKKQEPYTRFMYCPQSTMAAKIESGKAAKPGQTPLVIAVSVKPYIDRLALVEPQEIIPDYCHQVIEIRGGIKRDDIFHMISHFYGLHCAIMDKIGSGIPTETMLAERYAAIHARATRTA